MIDTVDPISAIALTSALRIVTGASIGFLELRLVFLSANREIPSSIPGTSPNVKGGIEVKW